MDRGDSESAVRILPAPGGRPNESSDRNNEERSRRTWMLPAVVAATALLAFVALTAGDGEETAVPTTTLPPGLSAVSTELVDISSTSHAPPVTEEWDAIDFYRFTSAIKDAYDRDQRETIVEMLCEIILADGTITDEEMNMGWRIAGLLGFDNREWVMIRKRVEDRLSA